MTLRNRRWVLAARPSNGVSPAHFRRDDGPIPAPGPGEVLVRAVYQPVDPGMLPVLTNVPIGVDAFEPIPIGGLVGYMGVGVVEQSRDPVLKQGDWVAGMLMWQDYAAVEASAVRRVTPDVLPPTTWLGILGVPGLSAWTGLLCVGELKAGETVLVTSAAGTVGSIAGQIARNIGCRVIGVAGGSTKCRHLVEELGFDAAIDRHAHRDVAAALRRAAPDGFDVLFDNVGNRSVDLALPLMRRFGRVVICGQIADYALPPAERPGIRNTNRFVTNRLTMRGLFVYDHVAHFASAEAQMTAWALEGRLQLQEHVLTGFDRLPSAFAALFTGGSAGRTIIRIDHDGNASRPPLETQGTDPL